MGLFSKIGKAVKKVAGGDVLGAAATIGSAVLGSKSAKKAADTQADAARYSADLQKQMFDKQIELQAPFRQAGLTAQDRYLTLLGLNEANALDPGYGKYARDFSMQDFQQDPGYQFRLSEGLKALDRQAAARGGLISGNALKATMGYGQDMASQEYQNAFNRYQTNRSNQLNPLESLFGGAQTATNQLANAAQNYGQNAGELALQGANARASGYIGQGNALTGALNNLMFMNQLNRWNPYGTGAVGTSGTLPGVGPMTGTGTWNLPTY